MTFRPNPTSRRPSTRQRGIAMILVLVVVAAASIMAYGVIASATITTKITSASATRLQRQYLTESGLNLALYYLHNPAASPVSLIYGEYGNVHYPGESNISLGDLPGTLTLSVENIENGVFSIVSTGTIDGESITSSATIKLDKSKKFTQAATFLSSVALNNKVTITGGAVSLGSITLNNAATSGLLLATNGTAIGGQAVPTSADTRFPLSITHYLPYYFYKGKRYTAKKMSNAPVWLPLLDLNFVDNPCNVWYADNNVTFLLTTSLNGTLITTNGKSVTVQGNLTVTPANGMPGLVITDDLTISGNNRNLTVNGPVYIGDQLRGSGGTPQSVVNISGVLISGKTSGAFYSGYNGSTNITYDATRSTVSAVMDEIEDINSVTVQSWNNNGSTP